jgi:hypothetical protein
MRYLSAKKQLRIIFQFVFYYAIIVAACVALGSLRGSVLIGLYCGLGLGLIPLGGVGYYIFTLLRFLSLAKKTSPQTAVITGVKQNPANKSTFALTFFDDDRLFASQCTFYTTEAQSMVGKRVNYIHLKQTVFILNTEEF